jgi:hypothetical protein
MDSAGIIHGTAVNLHHVTESTERQNTEDVTVTAPMTTPGQTTVPQPAPVEPRTLPDPKPPEPPGQPDPPAPSVPIPNPPMPAPVATAQR